MTTEVYLALHDPTQMLPLYEIFSFSVRMPPTVILPFSEPVIC